METRKKTQKDAIYEWLLNGNTITPLQALRMFGCLRLSAVIYTLRHKEGVPVNSDQPEASSGSPYSRYWIDKAWLDRERQTWDDLDKSAY